MTVTSLVVAVAPRTNHWKCP